MAFISAKVIRGGRKPFSVDLASRIAEGSALLPSVLTPTWEKRKMLLSSNQMSNKYFFFIMPWLKKFARLAVLLKIVQLLNGSSKGPHSTHRV